MHNEILFPKSKNMLNNTYGLRVLNSPSPDQNFGEKYVKL